MKPILCLLLSFLIAQSVFAQEEVFGGEEKIVSALEGQIYQLPKNTNYLPDFDTLNSVGTLYATEINIPERSFTEGFPGVTELYEWFGIEYKGEFLVKEAGNYNFRLSSDDGSKLFINDSLIVNNDGGHATSSRNGSIYLDKSRHNIKVQYFQGPRYHIALQLFYTFNEVEQVFPGEDIEINIPGSNQNSWLWIIVIIILLGGGIVLAREQQKKEKKKKKKDDTCEFLFEEIDTDKTVAILPWVKKLRLYKPWIRKLVCLYLTSNFNKIKERAAFVEEVILALKANVQAEWKVLNEKTILDIVTQDPYYLDIKEKKWFPLKNGKVMISVDKPPRSVIGVAESYFDKKVFAPKTPVHSKKEKSLEAVKAIMLIFILKKNADLIYENENKGMSKTEAIAAIKESLNAFIAAEFPDYDATALTKHLDIDPIEKSTPAASDPKTEPYKGQKVDNRIKNKPAKDKGIEAIKVMEGSGLGETYEGHNFIGEKPDIKQQVPYEQIRTKRATEGKKDHVEDVFTITKRIKALLVIRTDYGPKVSVETSDKTGRPERKIVICKALSNITGKDLTPLIIKHEDSHADNHWLAWQIVVLKALKSRLSEIFTKKEIDAHRFELTETVESEKTILHFSPKEKGKKERKRKAIKEDTVFDDFKYVVFTAKYYVKRGNKNGTPVENAAKFLDKEFSQELLMIKYGSAFRIEINRLADAFHKTKDGRPITGFEGESNKDVKEYLLKNDKAVKDFLKNNPDLKDYIDKLR